MEAVSVEPIVIAFAVMEEPTNEEKLITFVVSVALTVLE